MSKFCFICLVILLFPVCGFIDLRPIGYSTLPREAYSILSEAYSPLSVIFNTAMQEQETQKCFQVLGSSGSRSSGSIEGDFFWTENELSFIPHSPWLAGVRYVMKLSGTARSLDGRELLLHEELPFFAFSPSRLPFLESFSPYDGASVGISGTDGIVLTCFFSEPMDKRSTEAAFNCEGLGDKIFQWLDDDKTLLVLSKNQLAPWTNCRWTISEKAMSREGAPLAKEASGRFITDEDRLFPGLTRILPLIKNDQQSSWGFWIPIDINMGNGLGPDQAVGMEFNKPMDQESLNRAFSFEPSLPGRVEQPQVNRAVFIPDRNTEPEMIYTMKISRDIKDEGGLKMGEDYFLSFSSGLPFLKISSFTPDRAEGRFYPQNQSLLTVPVTDVDGGLFCFTILFSLPFSEDAIRESTFRISLEPSFPRILRPVSLKFVRWVSPNMIRMEWEGLEAGKPSEPHYYKLSMPGGRNGIVDGNGSYLKEDTVFIIEAIEL
ncbi:MAG: hypothetical protein LBH43_14475 [Treponema sp.]|nr:hypothetical protein [Treponema sp.]